MAQAAYQKKLVDLKQAFENADTDKTGRLTEVPFKQFVQIGFKKECPDGMYGYLCSHYQVDPAQGLTWNTALTIWKESNPPPKETTKSPNGGKSKTPAAPKNSMKGGAIGKHSKSPQPGANGNVSFGSMTRSKTDRTARMSRSHNLGDFSKDNGSRNRSPSPGGTARGHARDKSLSNSMSSKTRSYRNGLINGVSSVSGGTSSNIGMQQSSSTMSSSVQHSSHSQSHSHTHTHAHAQSMYNLGSSLNRSQSVRTNNRINNRIDNIINNNNNIDPNKIAAQIEHNATVLCEDQSLPGLQGQGLGYSLQRQLSNTMSNTHTHTHTLTLTKIAVTITTVIVNSGHGLAALVDSYFFLLLFCCCCCCF